MVNTEWLKYGDTVRKYSQYIKVVAGGFIALMLLAGIVFAKTSHSERKIESNIISTDFVTPVDEFDHKNILIHQIKKEQVSNTALTKILEQEVKKLKMERAVREDTPELRLIKEKIQNLEDSQKLQLSLLQAKRTALGSQHSTHKKTRVIHPVAVQLSNMHVQNESTNNIDNYVPAGTHVRATIIGSVDAGAGVSSQAESMPMILRITDLAVLPNEKSQDLIGCTLIAKAYGDISSERAFARLQTLSCVKRNGEILEKTVYGNIFGPSGKYGIRGKVVRREGAILTHAAAYGLIGGIANGVSQQYTTQSISPLGATNTINNQDVVKYGLAQGMNSALNKLADYHIKRAEQYHPVIQIDAGVKVDVVFTQGFHLKERESDHSSQRIVRPSPHESNDFNNSSKSINDQIQKVMNDVPNN